MSRRFYLALFALVVLLGACSQPTGRTTHPIDDVAALAEAIENLGPGVDPEEASRAAVIAQEYPLELADAWKITGHPLVHNAKVLHGFREKGLCNDWAEAMLTRLAAEDFHTLSLHWSTSPPEGFRVIHHSAVISARGEPLDEGIVLDPWRRGGALFWSEVEDDMRYEWGPPILKEDSSR